jgi:hypothetical protein
MAIVLLHGGPGSSVRPVYGERPVFVSRRSAPHLQVPLAARPDLNLRTCLRSSDTFLFCLAETVQEPYACR